MSNNLGAAVLILGVLYFYFEYGLNELVTVAFILLAVLSWIFYWKSTEHQDFLKAKTEYYRVKTEVIKNES